MTSSIKYSIGIYVDKFRVINFQEQGSYFLFAEIDHRKQIYVPDLKQKIIKGINKQFSRCLSIEYNDQKQKLEYLRKFQFNVDINVGTKNPQNQSIYLNFVLLKIVQEKNFDYQPESSTLEIIGNYQYQINLCSDALFIEYIIAQFGLPYAGDAHGIVICFPTDCYIDKTFFQNNLLYFQRKAKQNRYRSYMCHKMLENICPPYIYKICLPNDYEKQQKLSSCKVENTEQDFFKYLSSFERQRKSSLQIMQQFQCNHLQNSQIFYKILQSLTKNTVAFIYLKQRYQETRLNIMKKFIITKEKQNYSQISIASQSTKTSLDLSDIASNEKSYCIRMLKNLRKSRKSISSSIYCNVYPLNPKHNFQKCPLVIHSKSIYQKPDHRQNQIVRDGISQIYTKQQSLKNVYILAHGYKGNPQNMKKIQCTLKRCCKKGKFLILRSYTENMDQSIQQMGKLAASQIQQYIMKKKIIGKAIITMIGHSMGGIILRACIQYLPQQIINNLHCYMSLASPHLGYLYCQSMLTGTGLRIIDSMQCSESIHQICESKSKNFRNSFIYRLSNQGPLRNFNYVLLFSSIQDNFVSWNSSRIQPNYQCQNNDMKSRRTFQKQMVDNIFGLNTLQKISKIKQIHRFNVQFCLQKSFSLESMIGRVSHIQFLIDEYSIQMSLRSSEIDILEDN